MRKQLVLGADEFQFTLLDGPLLLPQFGAAHERLAADGAPIELDLAGRGLIDGPDQTAVRRRQPHQVAKVVLSVVQFLQRAFDGGAEGEVLLARFGFFLRGRHAFDRLVVRDLPGDLGTVAAGLGRLQVPIGQVQVPVGVFQVHDEVPHTAFETGQARCPC